MRVIVAGQKSFGREVCDLVRSDPSLQLVGVSCPNDEQDRLKKYVDAWALPYIPGLKSSLIPKADLLISAHSHLFVSKRVIKSLTLGAIGYHPSLLPRHRGRSSIEWALRMRDPITGGTVYWLNDTVDGGPIAKQDWCWVRPGDTKSTLWRRDLFPMGIRLIRETLTDIKNKKLVQVPQDSSLATWEPAIEQPPLYRPELPEIGASLAGYEVVVAYDRASGIELDTDSVWLGAV